MPDENDRQGGAAGPGGRPAPGAKDKPAEADHKDEPTEAQDGGE